MKKTFLILCMLLLSQARAQDFLVPHDPGLRLTVMPLVGLVAMKPGIGFDLGMGYGHLAWGARIVGGAEACFICNRSPEEEVYSSFMAGARTEFSQGAIVFKSGIAKVHRATRDPADVHGDGRLIDYDGYGIPFQLDIMWGGRVIGLCVSAMALADKDGGSGSLMVGIPIGLIRF